MTEDLNLLVTEERIKDMPLETFYNIDGGTPKSSVDFVVHFVSGEDGEYLEPEEALKVVLTDRTIRDIEEIMEQLKEAMEEMAVPNE